MSDEFEMFWKHFPRRIAKGSARKAWLQTEKIRPPIEEILRAIDRAKMCDQWRDPRYIPHPATWLRQERWSDEHETAVGSTLDDLCGGRHATTH